MRPWSQTWHKATAVGDTTKAYFVVLLFCWLLLYWFLLGWVGWLVWVGLGWLGLVGFGLVGWVGWAWLGWLSLVGLGWLGWSGWSGWLGLVGLGWVGLVGLDGERLHVIKNLTKSFSKKYFVYGKSCSLKRKRKNIVMRQTFHYDIETEKFAGSEKNIRTEKIPGRSKKNPETRNNMFRIIWLFGWLVGFVVYVKLTFLLSGRLRKAMYALCCEPHMSVRAGTGLPSGVCVTAPATVFM